MYRVFKNEDWKYIQIGNVSFSFRNGKWSTGTNFDAYELAELLLITEPDEARKIVEEMNNVLLVL